MGRWRWWVWLLLAVAPPLLLWLLHAVGPEHRLALVVLDKTVPFTNRLEHRSLFWLLDHLKVVRPDGGAFDPRTDYIGATPGARPGDPPAATRDLDAGAVDRADLLYLVDTYGVYEGDLASGPAMRAALERSPRVYGGLTPPEADVAREAALAGTTVVAEFNTFASPTSAEARRRMERLLGVRWTRWIGRYFEDLAAEEEVPRWLRRNYEREWKRPWEFQGPGYALVRDDDAVEVLLPGTHVRRIGLTIERSRPVDALLRRAYDGVPYPYWFDVVEAVGDTAVLARFRWHPEEAGRQRLAARGLPETFPAVTRRFPAAPDTARRSAPCLYFAGDFADSHLGRRRVPLAGYLTLRGWVERGRLTPSAEGFFWQFYAPLMREVLVSVERRGGAARADAAAR